VDGSIEITFTDDTFAKMAAVSFLVSLKSAMEIMKSVRLFFRSPFVS
jgi:hypothetical protein